MTEPQKKYVRVAGYQEIATDIAKLALTGVRGVGGEQTVYVFSPGENVVASPDMSIFKPETVSKPLTVPWEKYLNSVHHCSLEVAKLAWELSKSTMPYCQQFHDGAMFEPDNTSLSTGNSQQINIKQVKDDANIIMYSRGSGALIYLLGEPLYPKAVLNLWSQLDDEQVLRSHKQVIDKIAPPRDVDLVLPIKAAFGKDGMVNVFKAFSATLLDVSQFEHCPLPSFAKQLTQRHLNETTQAFTDGNNTVVLALMQREIKPRFSKQYIIVDIYKQGSLELRMDFQDYDPVFSEDEERNFRYGLYRTSLEEAKLIDVAIDSQGEGYFCLSPGLYEYFTTKNLSSSVFNTILSPDFIGSLTSFTHAVSNLQDMVGTVVIWAGNFNDQIYTVIKKWTELSDWFIPQHTWAHLTNGNYQVELALLKQRRTEIVAGFIRNLSRNPFMFLTIAQSLHLLDQLEPGSYFSDSTLTKVIVKMACDLFPSPIDWKTEIKNKENIWEKLQLLSTLYELKVLRDPRFKLEDSGAFSFLRAFQEIHGIVTTEETSRQVDQLVNLLDFFDEQKNLKRLRFFPHD